MTIPSKTISGMTSDMIASWQASTATTTSFTDGDPLLAIWQSVATQLDFLQAQVQLVLALARAQTSTGADLDSWMAQFNFTRLPATFATGLAIFSIPLAANTTIYIPVDTVVQTVGGGIQYQVVADTTNPAYSAAAQAYALAVGQTSISVTIEALVGGSASNVAAGTLTQFGTSLPGISAVTNPAPITNGINAEADAAFRARFVLYLATLAKATRSAILAAVTSVQQGLAVNLLENQQPGGIALSGAFTAVVDDGSGDPPASLLSAVFNAVDQARAFTVQPFVSAPTSVQTVITLAVRVAAGAITVTVVNAVQNAVAAMVNELPPGGTLYASSIIQTALGVAGVASVLPTSVTIAGKAADLTATAGQEIRTVVSNITVTTY